MTLKNGNATIEPDQRKGDLHMLKTIQKHLDLINTLTFQNYLYLKRDSDGNLYAFTSNDADKDNKKALDNDLFPTVSNDDENGRYLIDLYDAYMIAQQLMEQSGTIPSMDAKLDNKPIIESLRYLYTHGMRYLVRQPNGYITSFQDLPEKNTKSGEWESTTSNHQTSVVPDHKELFQTVLINNEKPIPIMTLLDAHNPSMN